MGMVPLQGHQRVEGLPVTHDLRDQPRAQHAPESAGRSVEKPWYAKNWVRATAAGVLVIAVAVAAGLGGGKGTTPPAQAKSLASSAAQKSDAAAKATEERRKDATAQDRQAARADEKGTAVSGSKTGTDGTWLVGSVGTYLVGRGILPGTYRSAAPSSGKCQWARLSGFGQGPGDIIANRSATGTSVVTIKATDKFFTTSDCQNWQKIH
jgi:hypothetical protein